MTEILVTGGAGYIGSHTCVALSKIGYKLIILDNIRNSASNVIDRLEFINGRRPDFVHGDVRDTELLTRVFRKYEISTVVHFAGLKSVKDSVEDPVEYYINNVYGTLCLLSEMKRANIKSLIFSSSATVYGDPETVPVAEDAPRRPASPYGRSKSMVEDILADLHESDPDWRIARLRYFNPVGAHESGMIGEDPFGVPNNLMPNIAQVVAGRREHLVVFGDDYPTPDGTAIRDYIHVMDIAEGHVAALDYLNRSNGLLTANLGTGAGVSVLELVRAFEKACGRPVPYRIVERRPGDVAEYFADPARACRLLNWRATRTLDAMCVDAWRWQQKNPGGYRDESALPAS